MFFQRRSRFKLLLPYGPMLAKTKKKKKNGKNPNVKIPNSLNNFGHAYTPGVCMMSESESDVYFHRRCSLTFFLYMVPY